MNYKHRLYRNAFTKLPPRPFFMDREDKDKDAHVRDVLRWKAQCEQIWDDRKTLLAIVVLVIAFLVIATAFTVLIRAFWVTIPAEGPNTIFALIQNLLATPSSLA